MSVSLRLHCFARLGGRLRRYFTAPLTRNVAYACLLAEIFLFF